ncbi:bifunctional metallophosphatase/5'-nucleotidase [Flaviflexus massiliensis]|uniref:bifunctional metallophosphatase/5'-nucleotidase n=1 Tax=Flaviflexus massiliensis TaxID=1522309 RepID=UPI0006D53403|nr:bifunctional UDP-sugar hydrolase/5'-nucleotidase [Flaviflexus massiliensis]
MRTHLLGSRRPIAVVASVAIAATGFAAPASAAPADEGDSLKPQNTNTEPVTIDLVGVTDFHGYIETAPYLATQIDAIRAANPNTAFVSAGDNIGGSAYVSSIANDQPTLDILDAMGLDVSAVGNHEFDQGYADLTGRVIPAVDFSYLGANVEGATEISTPPYEIKEYDGVSVAFVGTVTSTTPDIVAKGGVEGLTFTDPVAKTDEVAAQLKDGNPDNGEADVVVALFHEGNEAAANLGDNVDVVFAGHTHVQSQTQTASGAPIVQGGQYGEAFAHVTLTVDTEGAVRIDDRSIVALDKAVTPDAEIAVLVEAAKKEADVLGGEQLATTTDNAWRGTNNGSDFGANRGTESSMGNHLANAALDVAAKFEMGADFGIINPGGIRHDMDHTPVDGVVTYGEAYATQPFGNTIGTIDLTGDQVYTMLEQQFQNNPSRPVLRLGLSDNITFTYDQAVASDDAVFAGEGTDVITGVWINGEPVDRDATYTVASNTFLLTGQDGFTVLEQGTNLRETGYVDLAGYVDYLKAGKGDKIPAGQRSVGISHDELVAGETATIDLASLTFTGAEKKPTKVELKLDGASIGSANIDNSVIANRDNTGTATVYAQIPASASGAADLQVITTFENGTVDTDVTVSVTVTGAEEPEEPTPPVKPSVGNWFYVSNDWTSTYASIEFGYGRAGDDVLVGDWNADGKDTFAVRRGNEYFVKNDVSGGNADTVFKYGKATDDVLVGDWDGDGKDTLAVRRGDTIHVKNSLEGGNADVSFHYGRTNDTVFVGNWDGKGGDTFAVRRGDTIHVKNSLNGGNADVSFHYGRTNDTVFVGNWDGKGGDTFAVRRGNTFYLNNQLKSGNADQVLGYGRATDTVFVGDWNGDGIDTPAVRR